MSSPAMKALLGAHAAAATSGPPVAGYNRWYDASDAASITSSGGAVSQWNDLSGNGIHFTQSTAGAKPTTGSTTQNSLNTLSFDGGDVLLHVSSDFAFLHSGQASIFIVAKPTVSSSNLVPFGTDVASNQIGVDLNYFDNGGGVAQFTYTVRTTSGTRVCQVASTGRAAWSQPAWTVFSAVTDPGNATASSRMTLYGANGTLQESYATNSDTGTLTSSNNGFYAGIGQLGSTSSSGSEGRTPWTGEIAEIVMYASNLSSTDHGSVESYLRTKWGL